VTEPELIRELLSVPTDMSTQFAEAWQSLSAAMRLTVWYGGEPMAWVIAAAIEVPGIRIYRRMAEIADRGPLHANTHAELLKFGQPLEQQMRAHWGDDRRAPWEWLFFARPAPLRGLTPIQALRIGEVARVEKLLAGIECKIDP
jgi:hypothetical protein